MGAAASRFYGRRIPRPCTMYYLFLFLNLLEPREVLSFQLIELFLDVRQRALDRGHRHVLERVHATVRHLPKRGRRGEGRRREGGCTTPSPKRRAISFGLKIPLLGSHLERLVDGEEGGLERRELDQEVQQVAVPPWRNTQQDSPRARRHKAQNDS